MLVLVSLSVECLMVAEGREKVERDLSNIFAVFGGRLICQCRQISYCYQHHHSASTRIFWQNILNTALHWKGEKMESTFPISVHHFHSCTPCPPGRARWRNREDSWQWESQNSLTNIVSNHLVCSSLFLPGDKKYDHVIERNSSTLIQTWSKHWNIWW